MLQQSKADAEGFPSRYISGLVIAAVAAGLFLRFFKLGDAPLAVDEYYFGNSILNVIKYGLPQFDCGGYYSRGVLVQYLGAAVSLTGAGIEFASRFWPAIASVLTIFGVWKTANLASGRPAALLAVALCSLSLWEIEFARFGRMYAPFQAIVVWYLYFQIQHLVFGRDRARWAYLGLSLLAVLVYKGAALLVALNFVVLLWPERRWSIAHLVSAVLILPVAVLDQLISFRHLGIAEHLLPPALSGGLAGNPLPVDLPQLPLAAALVAGIGVIALCGFLWKNRAAMQITSFGALYWLFALLCFCVGAVGFGLGLTIAGMLMRIPTPVPLPLSRPFIFISLVAAVLTAWIGVATVVQLLNDVPPGAAIRSTLSYVVNFPDYYYKVVLPWMLAIPRTTILLGALSAYCLWTLLWPRSPGDDRDYALGYLAAAAILLVMMVGILEQPYRTTRYTFFAYPVVLILSTSGLITLASRYMPSPQRAGIVVALAVAALFAFAEDFNPRHLLQLNNPEYRFRTVYDRRTAGHYYTRWDYRGVAEYINENMADDDRVVVFDQPATQYLDRTDGVFLRYGGTIHYLTWSCGGATHLWSGKPLLDEDQEVMDVIAQSQGSTWFVMRSPHVNWRDELEASLVAEHGLEPAYTSFDGNLQVYRLERDD